MAAKRREPRFEHDGQRAAEMFRAGSTYAQIAAELDISTGLVGNWIHRLREVDPTLPHRKPAPWTADEDELLRDALQSGRDVADIADEIGRPVHGVEARITALALRPSYDETWTAADDDLLVTAYGEGATVETIAERLGRTAAQVTTRVEHLRAEGTDLAVRKPRWTDADRSRLARRYHDGATYKQLAAEFGKSKGSISRQLQRMRAAGYDLSRLPTIPTI